YFFHRPALLREMQEITKVTALVPVKTQLIVPGGREFVADSKYSFSNQLARVQEDPYYCLDERVLIDLEKRKLLPAAPATTIPGLPGFYSMVLNSGALANSDEGYHSADALAGVVVDAVDKSGARLVILALTGSSVSNDHYPYYELLFTGGTGGTPLSFKSGQVFFYDVAGIEG